MIGGRRQLLVLLSTVVPALTICIPGAPLTGGEYAAAVLLLVVSVAAAASINLQLRVTPVAPASAAAFAARRASRRMFCPVITPRDPACPRAPGIG